MNTIWTRCLLLLGATISFASFAMDIEKKEINEEHERRVIEAHCVHTFVTSAQSPKEIRETIKLFATKSPETVIDLSVYTNDYSYAQIAHVTLPLLSKAWFMHVLGKEVDIPQEERYTLGQSLIAVENYTEKTPIVKTWVKNILTPTNGPNLRTLRHEHKLIQQSVLLQEEFAQQREARRLCNAARYCPTSFSVLSDSE